MHNYNHDSIYLNFTADGQNALFWISKDKRTSNDIQNTKQKTKDRATRKPLKTGGESKLRSNNTNPT
jgi:hypothetical protein